MFAVIKKNEGLDKVIDAPSLKAAYDKLMYSEEDMLEPGKYQLINDQNPEESLMFEYLPRYIQRVSITPSLAKTIEGYLNASNEDEYQGEDNTITVTAVFPDGMKMDVKCCGCDNDPSWTEAVLFQDGSEVCCTDVEEEFLGPWELDDNGRRYIAIVSVSDDVDAKE